MKPPDLFLALHDAHPVPLPKSFHRSNLDYLDYHHLQHQSLQSPIPLPSHDESVSSLHATYVLSMASESGLFQRKCCGVRWASCARKSHPFSLLMIFGVSSSIPFNPNPRGSQVPSIGGVGGVLDPTFCSPCLGTLLFGNFDCSICRSSASICPLSTLQVIISSARLMASMIICQVLLCLAFDGSILGIILC